MGGLFTKAADDAGRAITLFAVAAIGTFIALLMALARAPACTQEQSQPMQPVKFDHRHHVRDDGVDCLYCHSEATSTRFATVPPTSVCLGCHAQIWTKSPALEPVRAMKPIAWERVTSLPDFVYFDHHAHTKRGVGCSECHGRVDLMPQVVKAAPLTMGFCLGCHRDPAPHLRPLDRITDMEWRDDVDVGRRVMRELHVKPSTNCTGCHR